MKSFSFLNSASLTLSYRVREGVWFYLLPCEGGREAFDLNLCLGGTPLVAIDEFCNTGLDGLTMLSLKLELFLVKLAAADTFVTAFFITF